MVPAVIHYHEKFREGSLKKTPRRFRKTPWRFGKRLGVFGKRLGVFGKRLGVFGKRLGVFFGADPSLDIRLCFGRLN